MKLNSTCIQIIFTVNTIISYSFINYKNKNSKMAIFFFKLLNANFLVYDIQRVRLLIWN